MLLENKHLASNSFGTFKYQAQKGFCNPTWNSDFKWLALVHYKSKPCKNQTLPVFKSPLFLVSDATPQAYSNSLYKKVKTLHQIKNKLPVRHRNWSSRSCCLHFNGWTDDWRFSECRPGLKQVKQRPFCRRSITWNKNVNPNLKKRRVENIRVKEDLVSEGKFIIHDALFLSN